MYAWFRRPRIIVVSISESVSFGSAKRRAAVMRRITDEIQCALPRDVVVCADGVEVRVLK